MQASDIRLVLTCGACPEQYDALDDKGREIGYLRLRWGYFSVVVPDVMGELVYSHEWPDDEMKGSFDSEDERQQHLTAAREAIYQHYVAKWSPAPPRAEAEDVT